MHFPMKISYIQYTCLMCIICVIQSIDDDTDELSNSNKHKTNRLKVHLRETPLIFYISFQMTCK